MSSTSPSETTNAPLTMTIDMSGEHFEFRRSFAGPSGRFGFRWTLGAKKSGPPEHVHPAESESFRVVSGTLQIHLGEVVHTLGPNDTLRVPPNRAHRFYNPGPGPVVVDVELDGDAMETQMIPVALYMAANPKLTAKTMARMIVHDVGTGATVLTNGFMRGTMHVLLAILRTFGVQGFGPVPAWEKSSASDRVAGGAATPAVAAE